MRNLLDIGMASFTFYLGVNTGHEDIFVNVKEPELAVLTDSAEAGVLVAQKAIADISSKRIHWHE
jgi:hypothetical protein